MPKITQSDLSLLRTLCSQASPGPWEPEYATVGNTDRFTGKWIVEYGSRYWSPGSCYGEDNTNAELVAMMRNMLPDILDIVEKSSKYTIKSRRSGCGR